MRALAARAARLAAKMRMRGVSPVVAVLILIMIAVAGGLVVWMLMGQFMKPRTIASLSVSAATAVIPPDGTECSVNMMVKNDGDVPLNITAIEFGYEGATYNVTLNRLVSSGTTITLGFTLKPSDFGATSFVEGKTLKITLYYTDSQGNQYTKTTYATIQIG